MVPLLVTFMVTNPLHVEGMETLPIDIIGLVVNRGLYSAVCRVHTSNAVGEAALSVKRLLDGGLVLWCRPSNEAVGMANESLHNRGYDPRQCTYESRMCHRRLIKRHHHHRGECPPPLS